jgi:hypothetical protein
MARLGAGTGSEQVDPASAAHLIPEREWIPSDMCTAADATKLRNDGTLESQGFCPRR